MSFKFHTCLTLSAGIVVGVALSMGRGALAGKEADPSSPAPASSSTSAPASDEVISWEDARLLAEVFKHVRRDYVDAVDDHVLMENAVRGMVASLDGHSTFLDKDEFEELRASTTGNYSGVGIEFTLEDGAVKVLAPIEGTPAARAGMEPGDVIISIDGVPVEATDLDEAVNRMRGKAGTTVVVQVRRKGVAKPIEFTLERSSVQVHSVKSELLEPGYGYARILNFNETTGTDLNASIAALKAASPRGQLKGFVLDLRNNPGGVLEAAVSVSDSFIDKGVIVTADGRAPESKFEMEATPGDVLEGAQMVLLVNGSSASASEIVAGALKDHGRAFLIGRQTFGKGSVQTVMPLSDGRAIKLTTSRYHTPSGDAIQHKGITPDLVLDKDRQPHDFVSGSGGALLQQDSTILLALNKIKDGTVKGQVKPHEDLQNR